MKRMCWPVLTCISALLVPEISARSFQANCTSPPAGTNVFYGADQRSTFNILWSSLGTIFLCTWTVQHLSVSPPRDPKHGFINFMGRVVLRRFKWMLIALILPEFFVGKALGEYIAAYRSSRCRVMQHHARKQKGAWSLTHAFYANMGGVVLRDGTVERPSEDINGSEAIDSGSMEPLHPTPVGPTAPEGAFRRLWEPLLMNNAWLREHENWRDDETVDYLVLSDESLHFDLPVAINSAHLCVLVELGLIHQLPQISIEDIEARSKEDPLIKTLALGQVLWFITSLIDRKVNDLSVSQLEIFVLGFAVCSFITYLLWLAKPKDVSTTTDVYTTRPLVLRDKRLIIWLNRTGFFENALSERTAHRPSMTVPNDMYSAEGAMYHSPRFGFWQITWEDVGFLLGAVILGASHCIAWDFQFPTSIEGTLWKISSLVTTAIMPLFYLGWLLSSHRDLKRGCLRHISVVLSRVTYALYSVGRLYLMIQSFRSLLYLPPSAYIATWPNFIPHFG